MPRPQKWRKVCSLPACSKFGPQNNCAKDRLILKVDEYECVRLIDLQGLTQQQCAQKMEVARTTVQSIYASARKKIAECIVDGKQLVIDGGEYQICEHHGDSCGQGCCRKHL